MYIHDKSNAMLRKYAIKYYLDPAFRGTESVDPLAFPSPLAGALKYVSSSAGTVEYE
jgi:hypothetical protein